jgi:hypothetical protein
MIDFSLLWIPGIGAVRSILGWLENALKDGTISLPEWKELGATVIRLGTGMSALVFGLNITPEAAAGITMVLDLAIMKIYSAIKKSKDSNKVMVQ